MKRIILTLAALAVISCSKDDVQISGDSFAEVEATVLEDATTKSRVSTSKGAASTARNTLEGWFYQEVSSIYVPSGNYLFPPQAAPYLLGHQLNIDIGGERYLITSSGHQGITKYRAKKLDRDKNNYVSLSVPYRERFQGAINGIAADQGIALIPQVRRNYTAAPPEVVVAPPIITVPVAPTVRDIYTGGFIDNFGDWDYEDFTYEFTGTSDYSWKINVDVTATEPEVRYFIELLRGSRRLGTAQGTNADYYANVGALMNVVARSNRN